MIEARELSKNYGWTQALKNASFTIKESEVVGLLGPNGAGKTTLMKVLTGYLHPSGGTALIDGLDVLEQPLAVQSKIGYLPENAPLYSDMVVQEYLEMVARLRRIPEDKQRALISEAVHRTGLEKHLVQSIGELSKGYRQRVGLAQAIMHEPKVLILDEASSGLDPNQIVEIRQLIKELARHATVLISTHILTEVELTCERVLIINEGEVRADAKMAELRISNAAMVSLDAPKQDVIAAVKTLPEVQSVEETGSSNGFTTFRVTGGGDDICPKLYRIARDKNWTLSELHKVEQTLETVFRDVIERERRA